MAFISNGTTILDNGAFSVSLGNLVLISEQTASSSASISFTSGIDSTYPIYKFEFINIHPATDNAVFTFNGSTDSGSNYNITKTTTNFRAYHNEAGSVQNLDYVSATDLAQSTDFSNLQRDIGNGADESTSGSLILFNPASSVFVKHFMSDLNGYHQLDQSLRWFNAGYFNTTSAVNAIQFKMESGNIDSGTFKLYGIKDS